MRSIKYLKSGFKSLGDAGFLFNFGNILPVLHDTKAAAITLSVACLCAAIRFASELEKQGVVLPLPKWAKKIINSPGATLQVTGVFLIAAGTSALPDLNFEDPATFFTPIFSGTLGIANLALGTELNLKQKNKFKRIFNSIGQVTISGALLYASQDAPFITQALFAASGGIALTLNITNRQSFGIITPNRVNALGAISNVITHPATVFKIASGFWTSAYISLDYAQNSRNKGSTTEMTNEP